MNKEPAKLTEQYILEHAAEIHTYESFGRAISETLLQIAAKKIREEGEMEEVVIEPKFKIKVNEKKECIIICFEWLNIIICEHIDI